MSFSLTTSDNNELNQDVKIQTKASTLNYLFFHYNNDIINHICSFLDWKDHYNFIIHDGYLKEKIVCDAINFKKLKNKLFNERLSMKKLLNIFDIQCNQMVYENIDNSYYISTNISPSLEPINNVYETDRFDLNDSKNNSSSVSFLDNFNLEYYAENVSSMDTFFENMTPPTTSMIPNLNLNLNLNITKSKYKLYDNSVLYNFKVENDFNNLLTIINKIFEHTEDVKIKLKGIYHIKELKKIDSKINTNFSNSNFINEFIKSIKYCHSYKLIKDSLSEINTLNLSNYTYSTDEKDYNFIKFIKSVVNNPLIKSNNLTNIMIFIMNNNYVISRCFNNDINNCLVTLYNHLNNTEDNYYSYIKRIINDYKMRQINNINLLNQYNQYMQINLNKSLMSIEDIFSACYNNQIVFKNIIYILDIYKFLCNKDISIKYRYLMTYCFQPSVNHYNNIYSEKNNLNLKLILEHFFKKDKLDYIISKIGEDNVDKKYTKNDDNKWCNFFINDLTKHINDEYKEIVNNEIKSYKNIYNYFVLLNNYIYDVDINGNLFFKNKIAPYLITNIQSYLYRIDTTDIKTENNMFFFIDAVSKLLTYIDDDHIMMLLKYAITTYSNLIDMNNHCLNNSNRNKYTEKYIQDLLINYCRKTVDNLFIEYLSIDIDSITINKGKTFNFIKWFNSINFNDERIKLHYMKYSDEYGNNLYKNTNYHNLINSSYNYRMFAEC